MTLTLVAEALCAKAQGATVLGLLDEVLNMCRMKSGAALAISALLCVLAAQVTGDASARTTPVPEMRTYSAPGGHRYEYHRGTFTRDEAWTFARARGGYPVVFNSMTEHQQVVNALNFREIAPAHTGHYQTSAGREPHMGWTTQNGQPAAHLHDLFNSNGPDDGITRRWGFCACGGGIEVWYGPGSGKNEDAGVIWHDNSGRLEDVSVNHRGGVVIEFDR